LNARGRKKRKDIKIYAQPDTLCGVFFSARKNVNAIAELHFLCLLYFFIESEKNRYGKKQLV